MEQKEGKNHADLAKTVLTCLCICVAGDSSGRKVEEEARISKTRWIYRLWIVHLYSIPHCAAEEESISSTMVGEQSKIGRGEEGDTYHRHQKCFIFQRLWLNKCFCSLAALADISWDRINQEVICLVQWSGLTWWHCLNRDFFLSFLGAAIFAKPPSAPKVMSPAFLRIAI